MSRKLDLEMGQKVVIRREEMRRFHKTLDNIDEWTLEGEIVKIGRKYITVEVGEDYKRDIIFNMEDDYREKYDIGSPKYKLFLSKQDIIDDFNSEKLYSDIKSHFGSYYNHGKLNLSQLQAIADIVNE